MKIGEVTIRELDSMGRELDRLEPKLKLFKEKSLDLSKDLATISTGLKQVVGNFVSLSAELQKSNKDFVKIAESAEGVALSVLSMIPTLNALKTALPAGFAAASGPIAVFLASLAALAVTFEQVKEVVEGNDKSFTVWGGTIAQVVKLIKVFNGEISMAEYVNLTRFKQGLENVKDAFGSLGFAIDGFRRVMSRENVFDVWIDSMKRMQDFYFNLPKGLLKLLGITDEEKSAKNSMHGVFAKEPEANSGTKIKQVTTGISKIHTTELIKEKNALEQYRDELSRLRDEEKELESILKTEKLTSAEMLNLLNKQHEVKQKINELTFSGLPDAKTLEDFHEATEKDFEKIKISERIKTPETEDGKDKTQSDSELENFYKMKGVAEQIQGIFNFGSQTVFSNFLRALQTTEQIINLFKSIDAVKSVVGFLGNIFGFVFGGFAKGGPVPGSGNSDNVPALLTPGEFVIKKSRVKELIGEYGAGFLAWLNGGGLLPALMGHYASGGMVAASTAGHQRSMKLEVPDIKIKGSDLYLSWKRQNTTELKRSR
jgi:hypothetical protein